MFSLKEEVGSLARALKLFEVNNNYANYMHRCKELSSYAAWAYIHLNILLLYWLTKPSHWLQKLFQRKSKIFILHNRRDLNYMGFLYLLALQIQYALYNWTVQNADCRLTADHSLIVFRVRKQRDYSCHMLIGMVKTMVSSGLQSAFKCTDHL